MATPDFATWFSTVTGHERPRPWQRTLAERADCDDRLIRIPTGLGKTEGVLAAWLWHRVVLGDDRWPRRLVWCLPMRVLVEQTAAVAAVLVARARAHHAPDIGVHCLMGGTEPEEWHVHPERLAVFVGTQDMLLSRALNRGYGAGRARWPIDFGLLNHDSLWIMDEVQLMDVGLTTSVQLQAFRDEDRVRAMRPCQTWWMSATLQPRWLETVESAPRLPTLEHEAVRIPPDARTDDVWAVTKSLTVETLAPLEDRQDDRFADLVLATHSQLPAAAPRVTLAIVNRVDAAVAVFEDLRRRLSDHADRPDLRLVHSRFRPTERRDWTAQFLSRGPCADATANRIIVATQVVEAGVDMSAGALVTELAPWPSLVQRAGRVARYGGAGRVVIVDRQVVGADALPYDEVTLAAARAALASVSDLGLTALETAEATWSVEQLAALYPYRPLHVLLRHELDELFDTSPDLTGADLDISRFIRTGEERDLHVWWSDLEPETRRPSAEYQPHRDALCAVPVHLARRWLLEGTPRPRAWVWDFVEDEWRPVRVKEELYPGRTVLVDAASGGYDPILGFVGAKGRGHVAAVTPHDAPATAEADGALENDRLSEQATWKTIATHGREAAEDVRQICHAVGLDPRVGAVMELAACLHDWGKVHSVFQHNILRGPGAPPSHDLAKFPAMRHPGDPGFCNPGPPTGPRRGFRHELVSVLAVCEWLVQVEPGHPALRGGVKDLLAAGVLPADDPAPALERGDAMSAALRDLDAASFDLLIYLLASHHGKVRGTWQSTPHDQMFPAFDQRFEGEGQPIRGVRDGDRLPSISLCSPGGEAVWTPEVICRLDLGTLGASPRYGRSWAERVTALRARHGPFALAYLEALLRAADVRASRRASPDPRLSSSEGVVA